MPNRKNRTWTKMRAITIELDRRIVLAIGLMSGASHNGVSAAVVKLDERSRPPARLIAFQTFPYSARFHALRLSSGGSTPAFAADSTTADRKIPCAIVDSSRSARAA